VFERLLHKVSPLDRKVKDSSRESTTGKSSRTWNKSMRGNIMRIDWKRMFGRKCVKLRAKNFVNKLPHVPKKKGLMRLLTRNPPRRNSEGEGVVKRFRARDGKKQAKKVGETENNGPKRGRRVCRYTGVRHQGLTKEIKIKLERKNREWGLRLT